jgi:hypothetical protein
MFVPKKIPTLLALFILFFTIGIISLFVQRISTKKMGTSSQEPMNLMVTNISDTSVKIIWQTSTAVTGMVTLTGPNKSKITAYDERDVAGKLNTYLTHSVAVKNLTPNTNYTVTISSNGKPFISKDKPYSFQTGPTILDTTVSGFEPSYGSIKTSDGKPANGGLVVLTMDNSQIVSTLVTPSGSWIIPLNFIRTKDLSRYLPFADQLTETITVYYNTEKTEAITDINNDAPVPDMTIGGSYDFRNQLTKLKSKTPLADTSKGTLSNAKSLLAQRKQGGVLGSTTSKTNSQPKIGGVSITLPQNNASLVSNRPLIQGIGIPGKSISISVGINQPQTGKTTVNANGLWQYTPIRPLGSGKQNATITTVDEKGKSVVLSTVFTVLKGGSQVLGDATPSATLSVTPTIELTPTPTIEITPLATEPMPTSGNTLPILLLVIIGVGFVTGGIVFLL